MFEIDGEEITAAEHFAHMVEGKAESTMTSVTKLVSMRIPVTQLAEIDAFADMTGSNRNKVLILLLKVAVEEVFNRIEGSEVKDKFNGLVGMKLKEFIADPTKSTELYDSESSSVEPGKKKKKSVK